MKKILRKSAAPNVQFSKMTLNLLQNNLDKLPELSQVEVREVLEELHAFQVELLVQNEELLETQTNLEYSQVRYQDLFNTAPVGYMICDDDGIVIEANNTLLQILKSNRSSLLNTSFPRFSSPDYKDTYYWLAPS